MVNSIRTRVRLNKRCNWGSRNTGIWAHGWGRRPRGIFSGLDRVKTGESGCLDDGVWRFRVHHATGLNGSNHKHLMTKQKQTEIWSAIRVIKMIKGNKISQILYTLSDWHVLCTLLSISVLYIKVIHKHHKRMTESVAEITYLRFKNKHQCIMYQK